MSKVYVERECPASGFCEDYTANSPMCRKQNDDYRWRKCENFSEFSNKAVMRTLEIVRRR